MSDFLSDLKMAFSSPVLLIVWVFTTAVVSYSGPFGTYMALDLPLRTVYWGIVVAASMLLGNFARLLVSRLGKGAHPLVISLATAVLMAIVLGPALYKGSVLVMAEHAVVIPSWQSLMVTIFLVSLAVSSIRNLLTHAHPVEDAEQTRLLMRIDPDRRGRLLRLSAGDHIVDVITEKGTAQLRMRFSDALNELNGTDGLRVHRSHWVASSAIQGHVLEKGRLFLEMEDGALVPVSRNYRSHVEKSGMLRA